MVDEIKKYHRDSPSGVLPQPTALAIPDGQGSKNSFGNPSLYSLLYYSLLGREK